MRPALIGGLGAGGTDTDVVLVAKDVLNLNLKLIRGYKGSTDLSIAMERGEIDGRAIGWAPLQVGAYGNYIREGRCASSCSSAARRAGARCRTCRPRASSHQIRRTARCSSWSSCRSASPIPMSRRRTCPRTAPRCCRPRFMKTFQDPDYLVEAKKLDLDVSPLDGATVRGMIARLAQSPPELIARYKAILEGK